MSNASSPILSVIVRRYRTRNATAFNRVSDEIQKAVAVQPGFVRLQNERSDHRDVQQLVTVFAFETRDQLEAWEASDRRKSLMRELDKLSQDGSSHTRFGDLAVLGSRRSPITKAETVVILIFWIAVLGAALQGVAGVVLPDAVSGIWRHLLIVSVNVVLISYLFLPWTSCLWSRAKAWLALPRN